MKEEIKKRVIQVPAKNLNLELKIETESGYFIIEFSEEVLSIYQGTDVVKVVPFKKKEKKK